MKEKFITLIVAFLSLVATSNAQTTIYAYRNWQQITGDVVTGPVKFPSDNPRNVTLIANQSKLGNVYAGAYFNYKWYAQVTNTGTQSSLDGLYTIDYNTGERTLVSKSGSQLADMTYDHESNTMYGIKYGAHTLATIDLATGAVSTVANFNVNGSAIDILAIACDLQGQLYGVGPDDIFYKIDKKTATGTAIGNLGADAAFTQSMEFDRYTGKLYWANNGDYILYEIDVTTGKANKIGDIGVEGFDSTNSLFIPFINTPIGSPDRVTDRKAIATGNYITISWTNPDTDTQGNTMEDFSGVKIYRDETLISTIDFTIADAGQAASFEDKYVTAGSHSYKIIPFNSKGEGGADTDNLSAYVGKNAPGAVVDFTVTQGDSQAILNWGAPTEGMFKGEYDVNSVTKYVVTRTTGKSNVSFDVTETTFTDSPAFGTYSYSVYAVNEVGNGIETSSVPIMVKPADWIVMMTGEASVETGKTYKFYDAGGPDSNYPNSEQDTLVIRPASANGIVKVEFVKFDIESYDNLIIFNGSNTNSPKIGEFSSTEVPVELKSLESTSSDGALTFVFESDIMDRYTGWEANVSSIEKQEYDLALTSFRGDLYAEQGKASTYTVEIQNKGITTVSVNDYKVTIKDAEGITITEIQGVEIASMSTATLSAEITPKAIGDMNLSAEIEFAKDNDSSNNKASFAVNVLAEGSSFIEIFPGTEELYVCPASFMSDESVCQTIYYASEIGLESGLLKMISFPYHTITKSYTDVPVKIWVAETDLTDLTASNLRSSDMILVFDGNCPVNASDKEWVFQLSEGYHYSGKNLAIMVYKNAPGTEFEGVTFIGTYDDNAMRTRFDSTWDSTEDVNHDALFGWEASEIVPNVKLLFTSESGIESIYESGNRVAVYPNPATSVININAEVENAKIFSLAGQEVCAVNNSNSINIEELSEGIYILIAVTTNGEVIKEKVIKK